MKRKLKELRMERGLSPEQLAVDVKTSYPNLLRLEAGQMPRLDLAQRIAEYFSVSVDDIDWGAKPADDDQGKGAPVEAA